MTDSILVHRSRELAQEFAVRMHYELSPKEIAKINQLNDLEQSPYICHSHDLLDANMVMAWAFDSLFDREYDMDNNDDTWLWNNAWEIAKNDQFAVYE